MYARLPLLASEENGYFHPTVRTFFLGSYAALLTMAGTIPLCHCGILRVDPLTNVLGQIY